MAKLPKVYKPTEKPWVNADNATVADLKAQIDACPSGALTYKTEGEADVDLQDVNLEVVKGGPLLIKGSISVKNPDGTTETKDNVTAFCRCGASENKPYCDGTHNRIDFED